MSPKQPTPSPGLIESVRENLPYAPSLIIDAIAIQIQRAQEAALRIKEEGIVVRDMRGSVIPHPAIKIEADAIKIYTQMIAKATKG